MKDEELEAIAVARASQVWEKSVDVISFTPAGNLPSVKIGLESIDGDESGDIWVNKETGQIEQEDLD